MLRGTLDGDMNMGICTHGWRTDCPECSGHNKDSLVAELEAQILDQDHQINRITEELMRQRDERAFAGDRILGLENEVVREHNLRMRAEEDLIMYRKQSAWMTK